MLTSLLTLGGGVVTLGSLLDRSWHHRRLLLAVFPLEFVHYSRFATLIIGFALIIGSFHLARRKQRAYQAVVALGLLSVVLGLGHAHSPWQALYSAVMVAVLLAFRPVFTVRSSTPRFKEAFVRLGVAAAIALGYGVAGFWYLDRRDFGIDFTLSDSIRKTVGILLLLQDPGIVPFTRHARWFLESLDVMTVVVVVYSISSFFRPVVYRLRTVPHDRQVAAAILSRHGRSALDYFKVWPDKTVFLSASGAGFLGYAVASGFAVTLGDPVGPEREIDAMVGRFLRFARDNDWGVVFHQTLPDFLPVYRRFGLKKLKIGDDLTVDLERFSMVGKSMKRMRNTVHHLEGSGVRWERIEPPVTDERIRQAREVSDQWLDQPGRRERRFTLGMFETGYLRSTPLVTVLDSELRMLAFANVIPSYREGEATIDLMRHRTDAPAGVMDFLFVKLIEDFRARGFRRFNLGMAPMAGFQEREEASREEQIIHHFFQRLNMLFSYRGLRQYKAKFATDSEPRYLIYRHVLELPAVAIAIGRLTEIGHGRR